MSKNRVFIIVAVIVVGMLTFGAVEVGGKRINNPDVHDDVKSRIKMAVDRGDIPSEEGRRRLDNIKHRKGDGSLWDKKQKRALVKELNITEDQIEAIKELRRSQREDLKMLRKRYYEAFLNLLTEEQRQKWEGKSQDVERPKPKPRPRPLPTRKDSTANSENRIGIRSINVGETAKTSVNMITWGELKKNN